MTPTLELVADDRRGRLPDRAERACGPRRVTPIVAPPEATARAPRAAPPRVGTPLQRRRTASHARVRDVLSSEEGAVTAEYAVVIMAAVAFAGLLVAILSSSEIRATLVQLVENALGANG